MKSKWKHHQACWGGGYSDNTDWTPKHDNNDDWYYSVVCPRCNILSEDIASLLQAKKLSIADFFS